MLMNLNQRIADVGALSSKDATSPSAPIPENQPYAVRAALCYPCVKALHFVAVPLEKSHLRVSLAARCWMTE